ncbi:MAG: penicillin-binding protein activator [Rhodospirillum sp.]|nr:penicillin-binding protein activator [Rhodospirillum sp.]MCF8488564.1 penicillin-binding protein activator [Rhodospirillum sp.]MCF8499160.1 penicillin-binding protein activator [Rhodospirillum sp.]
MPRLKQGRLGAVLALMGALGLGACAQQPRPEVKPAPKPEPVVEAPKEAPVPKGPMTVALLLPLTGEAGGVGAQLLHAAQAMLMEETDLGSTVASAAASSGVSAAASSADIRLVPFDTRGRPEGAVAAAEAAVKAGASLVVGPLFGANAQAVRPVLAEAGIPALSLTNTYAAAGDSLFVLGHAPEPQVERILTLAMENHQGRVLVVGPDTAYGRLALSAARGMAAKGVTVVDADLYPASLNYNSLVGRVRGLARKPADVVLIPASGIDLVGLSSLFQYFTQVGEKQLLGTILWENTRAVEREISLRGGRYVSTRLLRPKVDAASLSLGGLLDGAMDPSGDPAGESTGKVGEVGSGEAEAKKVLAEALMAPDPIPAPPEFEAAEPKPEDLTLPPREPDNMEALVMDAVALAQVWSKDRAMPLRDYLTGGQGFEGASGRFRLLPDGTSERSYSVLELTRQGAVLVSAPVDHFPGTSAAPVSLPRHLIPQMGQQNAPGEEASPASKEAPSSMTTKENDHPA